MSVKEWTFLTNHAHVLICLCRDPNLRVRDLAELVGITERAVMNIISDLETGGYIIIEKDGRRNCYSVHDKVQMRHPVEADHTLSELLKVLA